MVKSKDYIVRIEGHEDYFMKSNWSYDRVAEHVVRKLGLTTPRYSPVNVEVKIFEEITKDGGRKERFLKTESVRPPLERMTADDYQKELQGSLSGVPEEFHGPLTNMAYDQGHSSGYEECIGILDELVSSLMPAITKFQHRIKTDMEDTLVK